MQELPLRVYDVIILLKTSPSHVARRSRLASPSHLDSHTRCVLSAHMSAHLSLSAQSLQLSCAPGAVSSSQVSSTSTISVPGAHGERSALQLRHRLFPVPHVRQRTEVDRTRSVPAGSRLVSGVVTALVLVLPLRSSPYRAARHEQHSEDNAHEHEGSVRGRGVRACSARHPEQQSSVMPP